jgi:endogenous inhibitor of DNA gyrase (YacG/DUF329 family)
MEEFTKIYTWHGKDRPVKMVRFTCKGCGETVEREKSKFTKGGIGNFCCKKCRDSHRPANGNWWQDAYEESVRELKHRASLNSVDHNYHIHASV